MTLDGWRKRTCKGVSLRENRSTISELRCVGRRWSERGKPPATTHPQRCSPSKRHRVQAPQAPAWSWHEHSRSVHRNAMSSGLGLAVGLQDRTGGRREKLALEVVRQTP